MRALVESGRAVRSVLVTPAQHAVLADVLDASSTLPCYVADDDVLRQVVGFDLHRGAVASAERWPLPAVGSLLDGARRVAVVERLNDYENLGVLFRNAAAFGIDAVLLDPESADPLYRRCVRVSIGHVFTVPGPGSSSLDEVRNRGFALFALTPARRRGAARRGRVARTARGAARRRGAGPVPGVARRGRRAGAHPDAARRSIR